jgi:hypothetical protein
MRSMQLETFEPHAAEIAGRLLTIESEARMAPADWARVQKASVAFERVKKPSDRQVAGLRIRSALEPLADHFLGSAESYATTVRVALELEVASPFGERFWQMALLGLETQGENVRVICRPLEGIGKHLPAAWPKKLAGRYARAVDDIEDLVETIALGLSPAFRAELSRRREELPARLRA